MMFDSSKRPNADEISRSVALFATFPREHEHGSESEKSAVFVKTQLWKRGDQFLSLKIKNLDESTDDVNCSRREEE